MSNGSRGLSRAKGSPLSSICQPDGDDGEFELSGKIGGSVQATEQFGAYGEISFMTGDDVSYGTKVGVKYNF